MPGGDGMQVGVGEFPVLSGALHEGAAALNEAGSGIPAAPDAGESTGVVAGAMAEITETIGALTAAVDACGAGVAADGESYTGAENAASRGFDVQPM